MYEKYQFIKSFNSGIKYDDIPIDELKILLMIDNRISEVKNICTELNLKN